MSEFAAHQEARRVAYHVLVKNSVEETEEERRRRRARGWKPKVPDTPDNDFGNMQITEPSMNLLSTQTTDDDFCEVVFEPPKEPLVENNTGLPTPTPSPEKDEKKNSEGAEDGEIKDKIDDKQDDSDDNLDEFLEATQ